VAGGTRLKLATERAVRNSMMGRILFVLGLLLTGCGSGDEPGGGKLTPEDVAANGDYCCYQNGAATEDSAAVCATHAKTCVWSETYREVDAAGRGTLCGYLICR
jgi:hypothetical protein